MTVSVWQGMSGVLRLHAATRQAIAAHRSGGIDDAALEAFLREVEGDVTALRSRHWAIDALVRFLGHAVWSAVPVRLFLVLLVASWWLRPGVG